LEGEKNSIDSLFITLQSSISDPENDTSIFDFTKNLWEILNKFVAKYGATMVGTIVTYLTHQLHIRNTVV
jgi:hypothetical protein